MKTIFRLLTLLLLLAGPLAFGQTDTLRYSVRGTVVDATGGKPLGYVSVTLPGTNYATVTNQDGVFVIKSDTPPRFVSFSLMGYKTQTVPADRDQTMRVSLSRGVRCLRLLHRRMPCGRYLGRRHLRHRR